MLKDQDDITLRGENLIISKDYSYTKLDFAMDGDRIFFWTDFEIHYFDLKKAFKESNRQKIALEID